MKRVKTMFCVFLAILCTLAAFAALAGCKGDGKYDVSIKVVNTNGDEFIFTPDVDEISRTFNYTGEEVGYYVESYQMPDHPKYGDIWLDPPQQGYDYISMYGLYTAPDGTQTTLTKEHRFTKERGEYVFNVYISNASVSWHGRNIYLRIEII